MDVRAAAGGGIHGASKRLAVSTQLRRCMNLGLPGYPHSLDASGTQSDTWDRGMACSEPRPIELGCAFEQATMGRVNLNGGGITMLNLKSTRFLLSALWAAIVAVPLAAQTASNCDPKLQTTISFSLSPANSQRHARPPAY